MASPFEGIGAPSVQILGLVYRKGREGKGSGWKGKGMEGEGKGMEGEGTVGKSIPSKGDAICQA